jgi:hypothetical protein
MATLSPNGCHDGKAVLGSDPRAIAAPGGDTPQQTQADNLSTVFQQGFTKPVMNADDSGTSERSIAR